jgi:hypothetical protein
MAQTALLCMHVCIHAKLWDMKWSKPRVSLKRGLLTGDVSAGVVWGSQTFQWSSKWLCELKWESILVWSYLYDTTVRGSSQTN